MAQNENYSQVDLRVGTEEQFNAKVGTLPAGTLFGTTDSTVSKADLSTDLKNEINGKINKPANPTSDSAVVINSSGTVSTKPLSDIAGKSEVAVSSTTPLNDEILWINPDGTSGGGSSGGGKLYLHRVFFTEGDFGSYGTREWYMNWVDDSNDSGSTYITLKISSIYTQYIIASNEYNGTVSGLGNGAYTSSFYYYEGKFYGGTSNYPGSSKELTYVRDTVTEL